MKNVKILTLLFFTASKIIAQNLVPNGSFEQYDTCPNNSGQGYYAVPWFQPAIINNGNITNSSSVEYYNSCAPTNTTDVPKNFNGFQYAKTGNAYAGFLAINTGCTYGDTTCTYREYLEVELAQPLEANSKYCVEFYCSLSDSSTVAISHLGLYFSVDSVIDSTYFYNPPYSMHNLPFTPQIEHSLGNYLADTSNWMLVSGTYIGQGNERFITMGNFKNDAQSDTIRVKEYPDWLKQSYYYIDDVSVTLCTDSCQRPVAKFNYNANDLTASFYNLTSDVCSDCNWFWYFGDGNSDTSNNPVHIYDSAGIYTATFVACNQTGCCNELCCDTMVGQISVNVGVDELNNEFYRLRVYPNPADEEVTITAKGGEEIIITDLTGRKIKEYKNSLNQLKINTDEYDNGIYFLCLYSDGRIAAREKMVIVR